jgi:tryptophan-rich sensory protein
MSLGAFKLNFISKAASAVAESYFILYSTSVATNAYGFNIDSSGNFMFQPDSQYILKISNTGSIVWQKQPSINYQQVALKANGDATHFGQGDNTGKIVWFELANTNGAENFKSQRTHNSFNATQVAFNAHTSDSSSNSYHGWRQRDSSANYMNLIGKITDTGTFSFTRWGRTGGSYDNANAGPDFLSIDSSNNIYARIYDTNYYLTKFDSSLTHQWSKQLSWSAAPTARFGKVAIGSDGSVYGGGTGTVAKIWKMDSSQARAWEYSISIPANLLNSGGATCVAIDSSNNVYYYGILSNVGYIFKINSSGVLQWTRKLSLNGLLETFKVNIINDIMYITGGGYVSEFDLGGFIMKLPTDGSKTGTYGNFVYSSETATLTSINEMTITGVTPTIDGGTVGNYNTTSTATITYSSPGIGSFTKSTLPDVAPTSTSLAVAHATTPYITIYNRSSDTYTKLSNPSTLPTGTAYASVWSPSGLSLAVAHATSPYITIYNRSGNTFTKVTNPGNLPTGGGEFAAWDTGGATLAVAHATSPYITIYNRSDPTTWTKNSNPGTLPTGTANGCAWNSTSTSLAVAHNSSPYITIYNRSGNTYTKITNPGTLPPGTANKCAWSPDGTMLAVAHDSSPYVTIYSRSGDTFTKITSGGTQFAATLPPGNANGITWSPNGDTLIIGHDSSPYFSIYSVSGTNFTKVSNPATLPTAAAIMPGFNSDGTVLAVPFTTNSPYFHIYNVSGTTYTKVTNPGTLPTGAGRHADWN